MINVLRLLSLYFVSRFDTNFFYVLTIYHDYKYFICLYNLYMHARACVCVNNI